MATLPCQMPEMDLPLEGPQTRARSWSNMRPQGLFMPSHSKHETDEQSQERSQSEEVMSPDIRSGGRSPSKSSWSNGVMVKNTFIDICDESDQESSPTSSPRRRNYSAPPSPSRVRGEGDGDVTGFEGLEDREDEGSVGGSSSGRKDAQGCYSPWRSTKLGSPKKIQIFQDLMTDNFRLSPGLSGSCESAGSSDAPRRLAPKLGEFHKVVATPPLSARSEAYSTSPDFAQAMATDCGSGSLSNSNMNTATNDFDYASSNTYSHSYSQNYSNPCDGSEGSASNLNADVDGFDNRNREDSSATPPGSAGLYFASDVLRHQPQPLMQGLPNMLTPPPMVCGEVKSMEPQPFFKQAFENLEESRRPTPPPGTWANARPGQQPGSCENLQALQQQPTSMLPPASNMCQPRQQSLQMCQHQQQLQSSMLPPSPTSIVPGPELWNSGPSRLEELRSRGRQAQDKLRVTKTSSKREQQPSNRNGASANMNTNPSSMTSSSSSFQPATYGNQQMIPGGSFTDSQSAHRRQPVNGPSPLPVGRVAGLVGGGPPGAFGAPSNTAANGSATAAASSVKQQSGSMMLPPSAATTVNSAATSVASMPPPHYFAAAAGAPQGRAGVAPR